MKRNITKFLAALALLVFTMPSLVAWGQTTTYTFSSKSWAADPANWISGKDGNQFTSGRGVQVTTGASGANATSPISFENVSQIVVTYSTNASSGAGSIAFQVGSNDAVSQTVTKTGGTTDRTLTYSFLTSQTGSVKITVTCTTNSIYVKSVAITTGSITPTCATPTFSPVGGTYTTTQNVEISTTTEDATIYYTTDGNDPTTSNSVYSTAIPVSTTTTIKAMAVKEGYNNSAVASATYTFEAPSFNQDWEGTMHGWSFVSVAGDQVWSVASYSNNHYAKMSGYSGSNYANEDWCISPAFNLGDYTNPALTFTTARSSHNGNELEVYFSNNYDGTNVTSATWTQLTCTLPAQPTSGYSEFTPSGNIDLSSFTGSNCYIGFKYTSTTSAAATWELDDIVLASQTYTPVITLNPSSINLGESNAVGEEISKTFTVSQNHLTEGIALSANLGTLSLTSIAQGAEATEVTWTYTPTAAGSINATITATSAGAETQTLTITGAAFAPVTGYSIDFENEASLYTDWIFANMTSKQTGNSNVNAHGGTYYGTTGGKATASVATKTAVATPYLLTCYVTKQSTNTTASTWYIQVSEDGSTWTDVATQDATSMSQGTWVEFTADLSQYTNVYVRVYYSGSTAVRNIDDLTLSTEAPAVAAPTFSPVAGTYNEIQNVTITCATEGATIYYTTDCTTPTDESNEYTEAITVSENTTIKAIAYVGTESSAVATADYVINLPSVATPTFNPAAGTYTEAQNVTIACGTEGASILYKLTENGEWQAYTTALTISETTTVWAKATKTGYNDSEVATATYTIAEPITSGTGTINFGNNGTKINGASVTGTDNLNNTWTITTVGTTSFTQSTDYSQVGSSSKPATSITFTTTLPAEATISSFEAKFGGFSGTAGVVTLKVGSETVGTGSLNATNDVVVSSLPMISGTVMTVTVTNIDKGVKCYYISYTLGTETHTLTISGYASDETKDGYYLIASPVSTTPVAAGMITTNSNYDLYYYDDTQDLEWINYKNEDGTVNSSFGNLVPGKGYLYANSANVTLTFTGAPYSGDGIFTPELGWNLIGNPYATAASLNLPFYRMNPAGSALVSVTEGNVNAMEGVFVEIVSDPETGDVPVVEFTPVNGKSVATLNLNVSQNRGNVIDNAIVRFDNGRILSKFQLFENSTKLYIPQGNSDYAVVRSAAEGEMPVNFRAAENGTYTINVDVENMEMDYLHLIDNMTGADVDLLQTPSYSFDARTTDYTSRFRLVFSGNGTNENGATTVSETFAYFNGSEWQISNMGEATLQVVDVMGRIVKSETISGNAGVSLNEVPGVYVMRLVNGENVKTQKIVVK